MNIGVDVNVLRHTLTGIGWYVSQVLARFGDTACDDTFFAYAARPLGVDLAARNVRVRLTPPPPGIPGTVWGQLLASRIARRDRLDCFWGPAHVLPISLPRKVKAVLTVHDLVPVLYPQYMTRYDALMHRLYFRRSVARADAIVSDSEHTKRDLISQLAVPESRITVINLGVDDVFHPMPPQSVQSRLLELGIPGGYVLAVGTIEPRKNYPLLFQALARLPREITIVIAGRRGWRWRGILAEIARLGLTSRVRLLDYVPTADLAVLYSGARMLVLPSVYEGFGLPILQAMACGCPVLASNCSSLPEIGGDAATYFETRSVDSLAGAVVALLEDDHIRDRMRARGMARAMQFTWRQTAERTLAVLRSP